MFQKILFMSAVAGLCAVSANAACTETVKIGTPNELNDFRDRVNGGESSLCGVLTADIVYNENVVNSNKNGVNTGTFYKWTPIAAQSKVDASKKYYTGTFDGQGYTIYGLYTDDVQWEPAFIGDAGDGAVVKNLNIRDSYFKPTAKGGGAAGIVGSAKTGSVTIDNCSFDGLIDASVRGGASNNGGLVGSVAENASLTITNSYNEGNISGGSDGGGLVGYLNNNTTLKLDNCYNVGTAKTNPLVGAKNSKNVTIEANDVGCYGSKSTCTKVVGSNGVTSTTDKSTITSNYETNVASQKAAETKDLTGFVGVSIEMVNGKRVATFTDDTDNLVIPEDILVDEVVFNRAFTNANNSTIVLPFDISTSALGNASFEALNAVVEDGGVVTGVTSTPVTSINAYQPYLVKPAAADAKLTFTGSVTLKATPSAAAQNFATNWQFVPVLTKKTWTEDEIGTDYGFSGKGTSVEPGTFKKIGAKISARPMRAYLKYVGAPAPQAKPGMMMKAAAVELPDSIKVISVEPEFVEDPFANSAEVVYIEEYTVPEDDAEENEDETLGLNKSLAVPATVKDNRWFNVNGRRINHKASATGAYINNKTPVIVK